MLRLFKKTAIGNSKFPEKEENNEEDSSISSNNEVEENLEQEPEIPRREIGVLLSSLRENDVDSPTETLNPDDTVGDAKRKLGLQGRRLVFRATPLDDAKTLEESGVHEGATLYATPADTVELRVRTITGKSLAMRFNTTDRVAALREMVESVLGIEGRHQALLLRGTELENARTLRESGVENGDVVHVVMRFRGGEYRYCLERFEEKSLSKYCFVEDLQEESLYDTLEDTVDLQVRTITGQSLAMSFNTTDRVWALRERVEGVLGVEGRDQALLLRGTELEDARTLRESGVENGDVVHMAIRAERLDEEIYYLYPLTSKGRQDAGEERRE